MSCLHRSAAILGSVMGRLALMTASMTSLAGCGYVTLPDVHYRLTVVVDTPEGRRSGSGVVEFKSSYSPGIPGPESEGVHFSLRGEAVPVKLANGKYLFALLKWNEIDAEKPMLLKSFADLLPKSTAAFPDHKTLIKQIRALAQIRASRPVDSRYYPVLAWFDDISNPRSIHATQAEIGRTMMYNINLVSMTLDITEDPVTRKIHLILPWLNKKDLGYLDKNIQGIGPFPEYILISTNNFSIGEL